VTADLNEQLSRSFAFGPFVLVPERQLLLLGETPVRIGGRALDILTALVERPGEVVSKRELIARAWPSTIVDEGNLKVNMAALRRALGDGVGGAQYIATVTGRGYRFVGPVQASRLSGLPAPLSARSNNLPIATTTIFGRREAIDAIQRDLSASRLVSIVGAGGIGKTTVALAVAEHALGVFSDGVWLVDLAPLKDAALAPNAIAAAIGLNMPSADALTAVCEHLRDRKELLVFDSCEHIIDAIATCADRILTGAPSVKILATSREPLRIKGERIRRLPGLGAPPALPRLTAEEALTFPAVQLFVNRASDGFESFALSDTEAPAAGEICRRLDGLPLAIELAATRVDTFSVSGLLSQLDDRLRVLSGRRAGPERHRTLAATLDWSYNLLSPNEAVLLRSVAVFSGVFDLEAASVVSNLSAADVPDALAQLTAKSLIALELESRASAYRLLETTRAYGLNQLLLSGEDSLVRQRHAEHVCRVLERATAEWAQRPAHEWTTEYGRMLDDLRGALAWASRDSADRSLCIRLTVAGLLLWNRFSLTEECRVHVSRAIEALDAADLSGTTFEMHLKVWLGASMMFTHGLQTMAMDAMQRALKIAERVGDNGCRIRCLRTIGLYQHLIGEHLAGLTTFENFASLVSEEDSPTVPEIGFHLSISEYFLGRLRNALGRLIQLRDQAKDARRQTVQYQSDINVDIACALTIVQWLTGSPEAAITTSKENIESALRANHHMSLSNALNAACPVFYWSGCFDDCDRAVVMLEAEGKRHSILTRRPVAMFYRAALTCVREGVQQGIESLERAVAEFRMINHLARMPYYLGVLADAQAKCGQMATARTTIHKAFDLAHANSEGWCLPEVQRVYASILIATGEESEAEARLLDAMARAQETGALSWQLRAATDLARLWSSTDRSEQAFRLLSPIYSEFSEGLDTLGPLAAGELLATLASCAGETAKRS
jgi:predicted ATPase/DNA-binding winged helix-turn-helix (wHTH) protein